jgi:ABC-type transport system substrate-binding protein
VAAALAACVLTGCNNPYPAGETARPIVYTSLTEDPSSLDPTKCYDGGCGPAVAPIYPAFLQYHYLKRDPFVLEPGLGAELPTVAPYPFTVQEKGRTVTKTGQSWTFHIKRGLRFQDDPCFPGGKGREILAADFLYSFKRIADPAMVCKTRCWACRSTRRTSGRWRRRSRSRTTTTRWRVCSPTRTIPIRFGFCSTSPTRNCAS